MKEISKLAGPGTVVTIMNAIGEQDIQASIKGGTHIEKLTHRRDQGLEHTRHTLDDYGINYDQIIVRGNPKDELVKHANSGKYDIVVLVTVKLNNKRNLF